MALPRVFVVSPHLPNNDGELEPALPSHCPLQHLYEFPCRLGIDHLRQRKTGPCFPLVVLRCLAHSLGFTLYPPGHVPYGRQRLAPVAPDGTIILPADLSDSGGAEADREPFFADTIFDAALSAADSHPWPRESKKNSLHPLFSTQETHLNFASVLLGIAPEVDERQREATAQILAVPGQLLHDLALVVTERPGYRSCGEAVCKVLDALADKPLLFERLAEAGANADFWPSPDFWDPRRGLLAPSPFRRVGTRASPAPT